MQSDYVVIEGALELTIDQVVTILAVVEIEDHDFCKAPGPPLLHTTLSLNELGPVREKTTQQPGSVQGPENS